MIGKQLIFHAITNKHATCFILSFLACLLAMSKLCHIFDVELIDLAFRLIMADVYPFAKALNISDRELTSYRCKLGSHNLTQGTVKIMKQVYTDNRTHMVKKLKRAGHSNEARALCFGKC